MNSTDTLLYAGRLGADHPGFNDEAYVARRAEISRIGEAHVLGQAVPHAPYAPEEHAVWTTVTRRLHELFGEFAPTEIVEANERFGLPTDHLPQLDEVSARLQPVTGFRYEPVAGLVAPKAFYRTLASGLFQSTQYIRHASAPFYTPEPDVIHEVAGHGIHLASDRFARLYRLFGATVDRCETDEAVQFLSRVFWHTMEFGVIRAGDTVQAYGAGILSSVGELQAFRDMEIRDWDLVAMGTKSYDITRYQDVLFAAESIDHLDAEMTGLLTDFDDDTPARLGA